jgi:hypothetical protein
MSSVFDPTFAPTRYGSNPTFPIGSAAAWWASQYTDPWLLRNPWNKGEILHYISGMASPVETGYLKIGLFTGSPSDPYTWVDRDVVIPKGETGDFDEDHTRIGSFIYNADADEIWAYYTGIKDGVGSVGLAMSNRAENGRVFRKYAGNPILTADGNGRDDGSYVSEFAVIREGNDWTGIYSYRDGSTIMPGYRYATSTNGTTWTKAGSGDAILSTSPLYAEAHQVFKHGNLYWLLYETGNTTTAFTLNLAYRSGDPRGAFTPISTNPILSKTSCVGDFDRYHVATGFLTDLFADGQWRLFYQGAGDHDQPYGTNQWSGAVAEFREHSVAARTV